MSSEANSSSTTDNIQVVIRVRPFNSRESVAGAKRCILDINGTVENHSCKTSILLDTKPESKRYNYDWVGDQNTTQDQIFQRVGKPMIDSCLKGYNCTVFAYGQTGAGKTYTMQGNGLDECNLMSSVLSGDKIINEMENSTLEKNSDIENRGLQPRVLDHLFNEIKSLSNQEDIMYLVKCSYYEIYNEQIMDLLNPASGNLQVREDFKKGVFIDNITEEVVSNSEDAINLLIKGARNRHVGATNMNIESSRSHSVFSLTIESKSEKDGITNLKTSMFHFVDLAGSERQKLTAASGERLKEASNINRSLTVLGSVINNLVEQTEKKNVHVRYRDSKLTFLLKDSLGGNSKTSIIANISPSSCSFGETLSTLKFAQRAKLIKNKAEINEEASGNVESLKREIAKLEQEIKILRDVNGVCNLNFANNSNGKAIGATKTAIVKLEEPSGNKNAHQFSNKKTPFDFSNIKEEKETNIFNLQKRAQEDLFLVNPYFAKESVKKSSIQFESSEVIPDCDNTELNILSTKNNHLMTLANSQQFLTNSCQNQNLNEENMTTKTLQPNNNLSNSMVKNQNPENVSQKNMNPEQLSNNQGFLKRQNQSQLELELLLRESIEIQNETENKLHKEYKKKDEFMEQFRKAAELHKTKELNLRMMLEFVKKQKENDKLTEIKNHFNTENIENSGDNECFAKIDNELEKSTIPVNSENSAIDKIYTECLQSVPVIMDVFQENLELKNTLQLTERFNPDEMIKNDRYNLIMCEILKKLDDSVENRKIMSEKFERLCLWKGMKSHEIKSIDDQLKDTRILNEKKVEKLELELEELKQENIQLKRNLELERLQSVNHKNKQEMYNESDQNCDKDIEAIQNHELNNSINLKVEFQEKNDDYQNIIDNLNKKIEYLEKTQINLTDKYDFKTKVLEDDMYKLSSEKCQISQALIHSEKKLQELNDDYSTLKNENQMYLEKCEILKNDIQQSESRIQSEITEKNNIVDNFNKEISLRDSKLKDLDRLQQDINLQKTENNRISEEFDTLQVSHEYVKDSYDECLSKLNTIETENNELKLAYEKLSKEKSEGFDDFNKSKKGKDSCSKEFFNQEKIDTLNNEVGSLKSQLQNEMQAKDVAIKANSELKESEKKYNSVFADLKNEITKKNKLYTNAQEQLNQKITETEELNRNNKLVSSDNENLKAEFEKLDEQIKNKDETILTNENEIRSYSLRVDELSTAIGKKIEEIHQITDNCNQLQLEMYTLNEDQSTTKSETSREVTKVAKLLKEANDQNKTLNNDNIFLSDECKRTKEQLEETITSLKSNITDLKIKIQNNTKTNSECNKSFDEGIINLVKESLELEKDTNKKLKQEIENNKIVLSHKNKLILELKDKVAKLITSHEHEMKGIKANFIKLDGQYKVAFKNFDLKESEQEKFKQECKLAILEKNRTFDELRGLKVVNNKLSSENDFYSRANKKLTSKNSELKELIENDEDTRETSQYIAEIEKLKKELENNATRNTKKRTGKDSEIELNFIFSQKEIKLILDEFDKILNIIANFNNCNNVNSLNSKLSSSQNLDELMNEIKNSYNTINNWQELEKQSKSREYHLETKMLRYSLLEKEIQVLKQKLMLCDNLNNDISNDRPKKQNSSSMINEFKQSTLTEHFIPTNISNLSANDTIENKEVLKLNESITENLLKKHNIKELRQINKKSSGISQSALCSNPYLDQSNYTRDEKDKNPLYSESTSLVNNLLHSLGDFNTLTPANTCSNKLNNSLSNLMAKNSDYRVSGLGNLTESDYNINTSNNNSKLNKRKSQPVSRADKVIKAKKRSNEDMKPSDDDCIEISDTEAFVKNTENLKKNAHRKENDPELDRSNRKPKKNKEKLDKIRELYDGIETEDFDPDNYAYEAETPKRKKLKTK